MSRGGFATALGALLLACGIGVLLALPRAHQLGVGREMSCAEWFSSRPVTGAVRLTECVIDARDAHATLSPNGIWVQEVQVIVRPPDYVTEGTTGGASTLVWRTSRDDLRALADALRPLEGDPRRRFVERHQSELVSVGDITASGIEVDPTGYGEFRFIADGGRASAAAQVFGRLLAGVTLPFALLLVVARRRWRRRQHALSTGEGAPLHF